MVIKSTFHPAATLFMAAMLLGVAGCSLEDESIPSPSGPSQLGLSVTAIASPDRLPRDGQSRSVVTIEVRDAQGRPVSGQRLTLATTPTTAQLSSTEVTTDAAGRASVLVTAPPSTALGNTVTVAATPVGSGIDVSIPRIVIIELTSSSNTTVPTASFTVAPASPEQNQVTTLDASASTDEGAACLDVCTYSWDLGGEATRSGRIITYRFQNPRVYNVALTVTDLAGASATTRSNVTVTAATKPTITLAVSPAAPIAGQAAIFTATTTVASNHTVSAIEWNFGDGTTATTTSPNVSKTFSQAGTFIVTGTVRDDLGQTASTTLSVTVGSGITFPAEPFSVSPTPVRPGVASTFNGSGITTTGGAVIETWTWDFGDGTDPVEEEDAIVNHAFPAAAEDKTYVVRLTVTDSEGRTATAQRSILADVP
jgi:PKD repeat protein